MGYIENLCPELIRHIFSYIPITTLKNTNSDYFKNYIKYKYSNMGTTFRIDTLFRNIIKNDTIYVLKMIMEYTPRSLLKRRVMYRKKKIYFLDFLNDMSIYYQSTKCRRYILTDFKR